MAPAGNDAQSPHHPGRDLARAWNLPPAADDLRARIADLLVKIGDGIDRLKKTAKAGAPAAAQAAEVYRKQLVELSRQAAQRKDDQEVVKRATECLLQVQAEVNVPVREANARKTLTEFQRHAGRADAKRAKEFAEQLAEIADEDDPRKRCDAYLTLEHAITQADLRYREQESPGSTWRSRVDFAVRDAVPKTYLDKVFEVFEKRPMSRDEWRDLQRAFIASYEKKIADMSGGVPAGAVEDFTNEATGTITALANEKFADRCLPENVAQLGKAIMLADSAALRALGDVKRRYPADATPQAFVAGDKLTLVKAAPKIESLVLQGGGGKGIGYPPLLEEMARAGMLDNVQTLVGTSIGALNATCLACGGMQDQREILDIAIFKQAYDVPGFKEQYPTVRFGDGVLPSCAGQLAKMDELTSRRIGTTLKDQPAEQLTNSLAAKLRELDDATLARLGLQDADDETLARRASQLAQKIKQQDFGAKDRTSQMITFRDLAMLHQLDPKNFKELTITGWEGTGARGHVVYFNAQDFPEMPVALAARISMGLPVLAPVYWNGRGPFYDGGIGSNAPTEAAPGLKEFYEQHDPAEAQEILGSEHVPLEVQQAMAKTMLLTFDDGGKANDQLYGQGRLTAAPSIAERLAVMGDEDDSDTINAHYDEALRRDAHKVYNSGVNALQVYHGEEGTMSLGVMGGNDEQLEYAQNMARLKGLEQIDQRADQAVALSCRSAEEALASMTGDEIRKFVAAGTANNAPPLLRQLDELCRGWLRLEELAQAAKASGDSANFLHELTVSPVTANVAELVRNISAASGMRDAPNANADSLAQAAQALAPLVKQLPLAIRPLVTQAVLVPLQRQARNARRPK